MLEDGLLVVWEFVHQLFGEFSDLELAVCVGGLPIVGLEYLGASSLGIVVSIAHGSFSFLILDLDQSPMLLAEVFENVELAIPGRKVQGSIPKLVLVIYLVVFLLTDQVHYFKATCLGRREERGLAKLVLYCWAKASFQEVVAGQGLAPFCRTMEKDVSKCVLIRQRVHTTLIELNNMHVAVLSSGQHEITGRLALCVDTYFPEDGLGLQPAVDRCESGLNLLNSLSERFKCFVAYLLGGNWCGTFHFHD